MHTLKLNINGVQIALAPIADETGSTRHEKENRTIASLLSELYCAEASKYNKTDGEPFIAYGDTILEPCSISHCHSHAVIAKAPYGCRIGIDIEVFRPQLNRVACRFLSSDEQSYYASDNDRLLAAWTMKEAAYKAAGLNPLPLNDIYLPKEIIPGSNDMFCLIKGGIRFKILYCGYILPEEGVFMTLVERDAPQS